MVQNIYQKSIGTPVIIIKMSIGFIYALLASFFWAAQIIVSKIILGHGENALNLSFWQTVLAIPFWIWLLLHSKKSIKIKKSDIGLILGQVLIGTVGVTLFNNLGVKYSLAINFAFLVRTTVIFTIIFAYIFLGEKITLKKILLSIFILSGAYLLTTNGQAIKLSIGDLYTLAAAACIASGNTVFGKMLTVRFGSYFSASISFLLAIPVLFLVAYFNHVVNWPQWPTAIIGLTILLSLNNFFRFQAYHYVSASFIAMIFFLTPVFVSVLAMIFLKETMTPIEIIGGILIIIAGIFVEKSKI